MSSSDRVPLEQNFSVPKGDDQELNFDIGPDDEGFTLVGSQIVWSVFKFKYGVVGDLVIKKTTDNGLQVTDSDAIQFTVNLKRTDTSSLDPGNYYHELKITDQDGKVTTPTMGVMTITELHTANFDAGEFP